MSFFDDVDEPPQRPPRTQPRRSRPSGSGRPPRGDQQAIQTRRMVATVVIVIVVVVLALLVHSCDVSENTSALRDYTHSAGVIVQGSNATAASLFTDLGGKNTSCTGGFALHNCVSTLASSAADQLKKTEALSVPGAMDRAQANLIAAMQKRDNGLQQIANNVQAAYVPSSAESAVEQITAGIALLFASDVDYTAYAAPQMAQALHAAGIAVGGANGVTIPSSQVLTDLSWLQSTFVAAELSAKVPSTKVNSATPGLHGHSLNSVSFSGATVTASGQSVTVPASPAPTFVLNLTNGGHFVEYDVVCKVSIPALHITQTSTIPQTNPQQATNCSVALTSAPTPGTYTVDVEVVPVPGEKNTSNNTLTFPVDFTSG